jgi:hypothetical protein
MATDLGVLGLGRLAAVDGSGVVTPIGADWSLGWWIGAEDRWHVPPVEAAVRQSLLENTPVVETRMRVPGGDVLHRAFAALAPDGEPAVVVEITNDTPVPVAVALVVDGKVPVRADGDILRIGDRAVRLPRAPSTTVGPAAFLPLPHSATLRAAIGEVASLAALPDAERVAAGWRRQAGAGLRLVVPDPALTASVEAARCFLLLREEPGRRPPAVVAQAGAAWGLPAPVGGRRRRRRPRREHPEASFLLDVRARLVVESPPHGLILLPELPAGWIGQGVEVHDAPTTLGTLSFAVRWHGSRPALLWDLRGEADHRGLRLTAPGLDPTWSGTDASGEALLAPFPPAQEEGSSP